MNVSDVDFSRLLKSHYFSSLERLSFDKYKVIKVRQEKICSSYLKNKYIGEYHLNEFGKPISDNVYFNISHSHGYVALVIDQVPVGLDIEKIGPVTDNLKSYVSNDEEESYIKDDATFFEVWTNKEALVKASGEGFRYRPESVPGLPLNNKRLFNGKEYHNRTIRYQDLVITVSRQDEKDFTFDVIKEAIQYE